MNPHFVKFVLFATILFALSSVALAQESNCNEPISLESTSYFNPNSFVEANTIINEFLQYPSNKKSCPKLDSGSDSINHIKDSIIKPFMYDYIKEKYPHAFDTAYLLFKISDTANTLNTTQDSIILALERKLVDYVLDENRQKQEESILSSNQRLILIVALIVCVFLLTFLIKIAFRVFRKENCTKDNDTMKVSNSSHPVIQPTSDDNAGIEVRSVTTTVLRKQSLENVVGNDNYLVIDGKDFCDSTAVRRLYIKNECIKGIYNMYAEDIRKSDNPNENGCMVVGRWVYDSDCGQYDVSLEEIVFPGKDAVFSQYEINFGGIIKMKIYDRLQILRKETELQYDVTCWVHSHPNLGVFFSNADCDVQMQLKHPTHPNFLTAIVVDILTPNQELGIFTFQKDGTIYSKAELKRLFSLKDWYHWAVASDGNFNTLLNTKNQDVSCHAILLSDNVILDMRELACDSNDGAMRLILGTTRKNAKGETEFSTDKLCEASPTFDNELIGAFVVDLYGSIPSVRKAVVDYLDKIKFVLVYSLSNMKLTSIPIVNNDLSEDISFYGEQNFEELIKWTRKTN